MVGRKEDQMTLVLSGVRGALGATSIVVGIFLVGAPSFSNAKSGASSQELRGTILPGIVFRMRHSITT